MERLAPCGSVAHVAPVPAAVPREVAAPKLHVRATAPGCEIGEELVNVRIGEPRGVDDVFAQIGIDRGHHAESSVVPRRGLPRIDYVIVDTQVSQPAAEAKHDVYPSSVHRVDWCLRHPRLAPDPVCDEASTIENHLEVAVERLKERAIPCMASDCTDERVLAGRKLHVAVLERPVDGC